MACGSRDIAEIYERHVDTVYRVCYTYLKNAADTEDAVSDTFYNMIKSDKAFESEIHEKAWFIRCSINCCTDIYRKQKYKSSYEENEDNIDITQISYEFDNELDELNGSLYEILSFLPEKIKYAIYLFYIEEYKTDEIAKILKTSDAAIRMRLKRGREILKEKLLFQKKIIIEEEFINV